MHHTCALLGDGSVRCWGFGADGQLGYGNANTIGDDETPGSVGPVNLGAGRTAKAISAGDYHTCALLDDGSVRCWGLGGNGRLGYGTTANVGDRQTPGSVGPVNLGAGRTARAISAGGTHTCAVLDDGNVRCWGYGFTGQLGYGNQDTIGDDENPGSVAPVNLGVGRTAVAISAGEIHTCALLDDGSVRCWGYGRSGRLGYGNNDNVGDDEAPGSVEPVNLGTGRTAVAISAGTAHTCAVLDDGSVRCWGYGANGQLGYGNTETIGDNETPNMVAPVNLGTGRRARAITARAGHTCVVLDDGSVRCWGYGDNGRLGYGNADPIGDDETPAAVGPVNLGVGRSAAAISAGGYHTCARLDDGSVRCWGYGGDGRLGYCNQDDIGDDEVPGSVGPVDLQPGDRGARCTSPVGLATKAAAVPERTTVASGVPTVVPDAVRARAFVSCLATVANRAERERRLGRRGSAHHRANARRRLARHADRGRRRCLGVYGRIPGRITGLRARAVGKGQIELDFHAPGTDGDHSPPARSYLIRQSRRPIRTARDFARGQSLCLGVCRFTPNQVGGKVSLTVTDLPSHTIYYYAVAARDNVSAARGPRSQAIKQRTG
jgi:alpha-tubulin suppressor-like RCC1 family protein